MLQHKVKVKKPNSRLPEVLRALERELNVNMAKFRESDGGSLFNRDPPVPPVMVQRDLIPSQRAICQLATMYEVPNVPLTEIPEALEEQVNAKLAKCFANNESNAIN